MLRPPLSDLLIPYASQTLLQSAPDTRLQYRIQEAVPLPDFLFPPVVPPPLPTYQISSVGPSAKKSVFLFETQRKKGERQKGGKALCQVGYRGRRYPLWHFPSLRAHCHICRGEDGRCGRGRVSSSSFRISGSHRRLRFLTAWTPSSYLPYSVSLIVFRRPSLRFSREFRKIESLWHGSCHPLPVGKIVSRQRCAEVFPTTSKKIPPTSFSIFTAGRELARVQTICIFSFSSPYFSLFLGASQLHIPPFSLACQVAEFALLNHVFLVPLPTTNPAHYYLCTYTTRLTHSRRTRSFSSVPSKRRRRRSPFLFGLVKTADTQTTKRREREGLRTPPEASSVAGEIWLGKEQVVAVIQTKRRQSGASKAKKRRGRREAIID